MKDAQVIQKLEKDIRKHRMLYYNEQPEISDESFDEMVDRLKALELESTVLGEVGAPIKDAKNKIKHTHVMGSLEKCNTQVEFVKWLNDNEVESVVIEEKLDGASLDVKYVDGFLQCLATRGNGTLGTNVTHHVDSILDLPKKIGANGTVHVRGEVIIHLSDFQTINSELDEEDKAANSRNLASGTLGSDTPMPERKLRFVACSVIGLKTSEEMEDITFLVKNKFKPTKSLITSKETNEDGLSTFDEVGIAEFVKYIRDGYIKSERAKLDYMIDGLVLKINSKRHQEELGYKRGKPVWAIAYKFPAEEVTTTLEDVEWNLSNTGIMAPRAVFKPVQLAGTTVTYAYLHNLDYIKDLCIKIGDTVSVKKAGDIIPQVVAKVSDGKKRKEINPPICCPSCHISLTYDGKFIKCLSNACPDKAIGILKSYIKRLKIDELGDIALQKFVKEGVLKQPADLYKLTEKRAEEIHGKNGIKIVKNVQAIKTLTLPELFASMMIAGSGKTSFEEIVKNGFDTVEKILNMTIDQLCLVPGFQETKADKIIEGIKLRKPHIVELLKYVEINLPIKVDGPLNGLTFCFTGSMQLSRDEMGKVVESKGGSIMSVKKELSFLVAEDPDESGGKLEKARKLGVKIISEETFWALIK